jgi:hypothetical protein
MGRDNQGIDMVDTLLGGAGGIFSRAGIWLGLGLAGMIIGGVGYLLHGLVLVLMEGYNPLDYLSIDAGEALHGIISLPLLWLWMILRSFMHGIGLLYLPFVAFGTIMFLMRDDFDEPLFFLHLIIGPWATLSLGDDGFPWTALVVWLPWSGTLIGLWWLRSRSGSEADFRVKEMKEVLGVEFSVLNQPTAPAPEVEVVKPAYVNVSLPAPKKAPPKEGDAE